jgi:hypothetical protein
MFLLLNTNSAFSSYTMLCKLMNSTSGSVLGHDKGFKFLLLTSQSDALSVIHFLRHHGFLYFESTA